VTHGITGHRRPIQAYSWFGAGIAGLRAARTIASGLRCRESLDHFPWARASEDRGGFGCDLGQCGVVRAVGLVHEEPGEADPGYA
jgi:hypothetical protein